MRTKGPLDRRAVPLGVIVVFALALWGGEYLRRGLWEPDEARYAYIAREMQAAGRWAIPTRHGELYPDKPPLMFWLIQAGTLLTGGRVNGVSARLPSLLGSVVSLWVLCRLAALWTDRRKAWRALVILPTSLLFWHQGGMGQIDALLCGLQMLGLYALFTFDLAPSRPRLAAAYLCLGLAVLTKGPVGLLVPLGVYLAAHLAAGEARQLARRHWLWGLPLALLLPALWLAMAWRQGAPPEYFRALLGQNVVRATSGTGHNNPWYFFLYHFPLDFMPWTLFLPAAVAAAPLTPVRRRLLGWVAFVLLFFSLLTDKRNLYILLAYPAAALFVADAWDAIAALSAPWRRGVASAAAGWLLLLAAALLGASLYPRLPFARWPLWPPAALALAGAWAVWRSYRRRDVSPHLLYVFAGAMFWVQLAVGALVFPALNPLKTPVELAAAAPRLLPPDREILLYGAKAEIMALYAQRPGRRVDDPRALAKAMRAQGQGIVVFPARDWEALAVPLPGRLTPHPFRMGRKEFFWVEFDTTAAPRPSPPPASQAAPRAAPAPTP